MFTKLLALSISGPGGQIDVSAPSGIPGGGIIKLGTILTVALGILIIAAIILCLFVIIWGGFSWMTSGGDKQKLNQARQKIVYAIIGLVVVFLAMFFVNLIFTFFGRPGEIYLFIFQVIGVFFPNA